MTKNEPNPLSYDWHAFNDRHPDPEALQPDAEGDDAPSKTPEDECETCGAGRDALVHQVDDSGNPTLEARQAAERGDTTL